MAYDVEDKVVQMRFDNREFDPNIDASIESLKKLEKSLQLANGTKGLENIEKSSKNFNLNPALTAVESLKHGFSTMEVVAITAISNITNRAMAMGRNIINAFTIAPIRSGFGEYSEQMNSTQVILSNLSNETLPSVTASLDELNEYADRTIYSFGQMTQAIGKFAAAGVELKPATAAIKGLSSAAATVGANNQQLFSAYYNLAQSLQLGYLQLIDWKSLEYSTIGNRTMKKAFIETAIQMGKFTKESEIAQEAYADFRGSLSKKWLTSDVIIETLNKYSRSIKEIDGALYEVSATGEKLHGDLTKPLEATKDAITGVVTYTLESGEKIEEWEAQLASTAFKAATEIKSFSQMWDTLTEAAGTGWADTWKIIFGDLEKAKELWTNIAKPLDKTISTFNDLRNKALEWWAAIGGRQDLLDSLVNFSKAFGQNASIISKTFDKLIGYTVIEGKEISNASIAFRKATGTLKIFSEYLLKSDEEVEAVSDSLANLLRPLKVVAKVVGFIFKIALSGLVLGVAIIRTIFKIITNLSLIPQMIDEIFGHGTWEKVANVLTQIVDGFMSLASIVVQAIGLLKDVIVSALSPIIEFIKNLGIFENIGTTLPSVIQFIAEKVLYLLDCLNKGIKVVRSFIQGNPLNIASILGLNGEDGGKSFIQGITKGLRQGGAVVEKAASRLGSILVGGFRGKHGINAHSPAKTGIEGGEDFDDGVVVGLKRSLKKVRAASREVGRTVAGETTAELQNNSNIWLEMAQHEQMLKDAQEDIDPSGAMDLTFHTVNKINDSLDKTSNTAEASLGVFDKVLSITKTIGASILNFAKSISLADVIIVAFSAAIVSLIFNISRTIGEAKEVLEGFGRSLKATSARIWAEAFDQIGQAIFNIAKSLALLTLLGSFNPEGLKQSAIILGIFTAGIVAMIIAFSKLVTVTDKLKALKSKAEALGALVGAFKKVLSFTTVAVSIAAFSFSLIALSRSMKILSEIDGKQIAKSLITLTLLMGTIIGFSWVVSKFTTKLGAATLLTFAFAYALKLFIKAVGNVGEGGLNDGLAKITQLSIKDITVLVALIAALTIVSGYINKASFALSKVILSLTLLSVGIGLMVVLLGIIKDNELARSLLDSITNWKFVTAVILTLVVSVASFTIASGVLAKVVQKTRTNLNKLYTGLAGLKIIFTTLATSIAIIVGSMIALMATLAIINKQLGGPGQMMMVLGSAAGVIMIISVMLVKLIASLALVSGYINENKIKEDSFNTVASVLKKITRSLLAITAIMVILLGAFSLFWKQYQDNIGMGVGVLISALVSIGLIMGGLAGMLKLISSEFNYNKNITNGIAMLIPIVVMIGELVGAMMIFSTYKNPWDRLAPGMAAISLIMLNVSLLISQIAKISKDTSKSLTQVSGDSGTLINEESSFKNVIFAITSIMGSIAVFMAEVSVLGGMITSGKVSWKALAASVIAFSLLIAQVTASIRLIFASANAVNKENVGGVFASLMGIFGALTTLLGMLGGVVWLIGRSINADFNSGDVVFVMASLTTAILVIANLAMAMIKKLGVLTYFPTALNSFLTVLGSLSLVIAELAGVIFLLKGVNTLDMAAKLLSLTFVATALSFLAYQLTKFVKESSGVKTAIVLLANISGIVALLGGISFLLKDIDTEDFANKLWTLTAIVAALAAVTAGLAYVSKLVSSAGKMLAIAPVFLSIGLAMVSLAGSLMMIASIPVDKINLAINALAEVAVMFGMMSLLSVVMGAAFSAMGAYSAIVIAVIGALTLGILAFAKAVTMISESNPEVFVDLLKQLYEIGGPIAAVGAALLALGVGTLVFGAGAMLAAPAILIFATSLYVAAQATSILSQNVKGFLLFVEALRIFISLTGSMIGMLTVLTIFGPTLLILSAALFAFALASQAINLIASNIDNMAMKLATAGTIILKNQMAFAMLGGALLALGTILLLTAPGFLLLSIAISTVAVSIGVLLALAAPFALAIGLVLNGLAAIILRMKDAFISLFDAIIDRLPKIIGMLQSVSGDAQNIMIISQALVIFGVALVSIGVGGLLASVAILALAGAIKVMDLALKSVGGPMANIKSIFETIVSKRQDIEDLSLTFGLAGLMLVGFAAGLLTTALGILALAGAIAVLNNAIKASLPTIDELFARGGKIAAIGAALIALGAGMAVLGTGLLVLSVPILLIVTVLSILAIVLTLVATICVTILAPAISMIAIALVPLAAVISMIVMSINNILQSLLALAQNGNLLGLSIGLVAVASAFAFMAVISALIAPLIPLLLLMVNVMELFGKALSKVGVALAKFGAGLKLAVISIVGSLNLLSDVFIRTCRNIKTGIETIKNLFSFSKSAGTNFVKGFTNSITDGLKSVKYVVGTMASTAMKGLTGPLEIHSPSEFTAWVGRMFSSGFNKEVAGEMPNFFASGRDAGEAAGNGLFSGLTNKLKGSKIGKFATTVGDVIKGNINLGDAVTSVVGKDSDLAKGIETVKSIFSGDFDLSTLLGENGDAAEKGSDGLDDYASSLGDVSSSSTGAKGTIESLTDTLKNQMKIFDRFTYDEEIMNPKELINNMKSQLRGMQNWANGIDQLAVRGMSGPLLQYLSEMGPEGYKYVESFLEMTESEFAEANKLYSDSLEMPSSVANQIGDSYRRAGVEIVESMASGMGSSGAISSANADIKDSITDNAKDTGDEVYKIAGTEAKATASQLETMASKSGETTGWSYFTALDKWMDSAEAAKYIASVQGKISGQVFNFSNYDIAKSAAQAGSSGYQYIESNWNYKSQKNLSQLGSTSAKFLVEGYTEALTAGQYIAACQKAMYGLAAVIIDAGNEKFDIHSPSKVTEEQGMYLVLGLANGIKKYTADATKASDELSTSTIDSISSTIQAISDQFTDDIDTTPTIRPVLDLTDVYAGAQGIDALFSTQQASIAAKAYAIPKRDTVKDMADAMSNQNDKQMKQLADIIMASDKPVTVNVTLQGGAEQFFDFVVDQNRQEVLTKGSSPLMIMRRNSINASLA